MKSIVAYPFEIEKVLDSTQKQPHNGYLIVHYELFKRILHLKGAVVKCGITAVESFSRFTDLYKTEINQQRKLIAFEKYESDFEFEETVLQTFLKMKTHNGNNIRDLKESLIERGKQENVEFLPGKLSEAIPNYLIENPELKIALLNIDLDDYESSLTALDYLYPRIEVGGILIIDNYHKLSAEMLAINTYFNNAKVKLQHFSLSQGPFFIIK